MLLTYYTSAATFTNYFQARFKNIPYKKVLSCLSVGNYCFRDRIFCSAMRTQLGIPSEKSQAGYHPRRLMVEHLERCSNDPSLIPGLGIFH